jgi:hypothetical protein
MKMSPAFLPGSSLAGGYFRAADDTPFGLFEPRQSGPSEPAVTQADQASAIKDQAMLAVDRSPDAEAHWQST